MLKELIVSEKENFIMLRNILLTIHKPFVRSHFDYGDIFHDLPKNVSFKSTLKASNIKHILLLLAPSKVHHAIKCMKK